MSLAISNKTILKFFPLPCVDPIRINLSLAVREKLTEGEKLTNAKALTILKSVKWRSEIKSFLTKPVVWISLAALILIGGLLIPMTSIALRVIRGLVGGLGGGLMCYGGENGLKGILQQVSAAYKKQAEEASQCIKQIEQAKQELNFNLYSSGQFV